MPATGKMKVVLQLLFWVNFIAVDIGARDPPPGGGNHVLCYFRGWNNGNGPYNSFEPEDLDPHICTHIIYGFAFFGMDYDFDQDQGTFAMYQPRLVALKNINPNLKIILGTGRWRGGATNFVNITASQENRMKFARNAVTFLRDNSFDGFQLNWEYPTFRDGGTAQDKDNYVYLAETLRNEFAREATETGNPKLQLVMGVTGFTDYLSAYDLPSFNLYVDLICVFSYDYNLYPDRVKHHAPLYAVPGDRHYEDDKHLNVNHTMNYFLERVDPRKLVLGIPTYGRTKTLKIPDDTEVGAEARGLGKPGLYSRESGFMTYFEICLYIKNSGWTVEDSFPAYVGPYAHKGDQWVSYDDEEMVRTKTKYAIQKGLAGVMFWTVGFDDYLGTCSGKKYPLISAAKEELNCAQQPAKTPKSNEQPIWGNRRPTIIRPGTSTPSAHPRTSTPSARPRTSTPSARPRTSTPSARPRTSTPLAYPWTPTPSTYPKTSTPSVHPWTSTPSTHPKTSTISTRPRNSWKTRPTATPGRSKGFHNKSRDWTQKEQKEKTFSKDSDGDGYEIVDVPYLNPFMTFVVTNSSISIAIKEINVFNN